MTGLCRFYVKRLQFNHAEKYITLPTNEGLKSQTRFPVYERSEERKIACSLLRFSAFSVVRVKTDVIINTLHVRFRTRNVSRGFMNKSNRLLLYVYRDGKVRRKMLGVKNHMCYLLSIELNKCIVPNVLSDVHHFNTKNIDSRSIRYHRRSIGNGEINYRA